MRARPLPHPCELDLSSSDILVLQYLCWGQWDSVGLTPPKLARKEFFLLSMVCELGHLFAFIVCVWFCTVLDVRFPSWFPGITAHLWEVAKLLRKLRGDPKERSRNRSPSAEPICSCLPTMGAFFSSVHQDPLFSAYNWSEINSSCEAPALPPPWPGYCMWKAWH